MQLTVLENIVLFILDIRLWTGRKKLKEEDLAVNGINTSQLPPGTLASLGSKKTISTEALSPFQSMKREAEKLLLATGVRFLGGYAVPAEKAPEISQRLSELQINFQSAKTDLLRQYDEQVRDWIAANPPEWASVIQASVDSVATVDKAMHFGYTPVTIQPPKTMPDSEPLEEQADGLYGQLCHEIRGMAKTAFDASYVGKQSVTRKALRPINAIREKLVALAFLDSGIPLLVHSIDDTLNQLPLSGPIEGQYLNLLVGLLSRQLMRMGLPVEQQIEEEEAFKVIDVDEEMEVPVAALAAMTQGRSIATALHWDF